MDAQLDRPLYATSALNVNRPDQLRLLSRRRWLSFDSIELRATAVFDALHTSAFGPKRKISEWQRRGRSGRFRERTKACS
jgi:hypothetical protein